ncbi:hypothetical protein [Streptomyces buecherae]|uniref:hypothetical protein n=1 Tax=Streptomyces buecherae TaxID=2763006 RepID=UPI001C27A078|nr:hypothetical protein [Streptomyces buecherae]
MSKNRLRGRSATDHHQFLIALGTPPELWLGVPGESAEERAARLCAARDILDDHPELMCPITEAVFAALKDDAVDLLGAA